MNVSGIYSIKNIVNGKSYIGSAYNVNCRWKRHLRLLRNNNHCNSHFQNSYNKYGESSFHIHLLEKVPKSKLKIVEQKYLDDVLKYPEKYYNINYLADRINYTNAVRKKMSDKAKQLIGNRNPFYGKHHTEATKLKIREKRKHQVITDDTRQKLSIAAKNNWKLRIDREPKKTDMSLYVFKNIDTNEQFVGRRVDFYRKYNLQQDRICRMVKSFNSYGKVKTHKHWVIIEKI